MSRMIISPVVPTDMRSDNFLAVIIFSIAFHVLVLIVIPFATRFIWRPQRFERPKTFQLVRMPRVPQVARPVQEVVPEIAPPRQVDKPKQATKPVPKKSTTPAKPETKPEPENVDELAALLEALPVPAQITSLTADFSYPWYLAVVEQKIRRYWNPPVENEKLAVVLRFSIQNDGTVSGLAVVGSSGDPSLDNLALRAVTLAAPFGRLPHKFAGAEFTGTCTLRAVRK